MLRPHDEKQPRPAKLYGMIVFQFGNGFRLAGRYPAVAVAVDTQEQVGLLNFPEAGLQGVGILGRPVFHTAGLKLPFRQAATTFSRWSGKSMAVLEMNTRLISPTFNVPKGMAGNYASFPGAGAAGTPVRKKSYHRKGAKNAKGRKGILHAPRQMQSDVLAFLCGPLRLRAFALGIELFRPQPFIFPMASLAAAVRVSTPSFSKTCSRCLFTVRGLLPRMSAMSLLVLPRLSQ